MHETDENLMLAVRNGEVGKLAFLFDRHHRLLFDFFAKLTGSRAAAEDLVQDVFFRILKYRGTFRDESRFKAWMFHIARNARIDYYRKHHTGTLPAEDRDTEPQSRFGMPGDDLEQEQQVFLLECALLKLAPEKREVLILSRYQDMKYEQIAEMLGCEVSTIKVRVFRAIKELRDIFFKLSNEKPPCNVKKSVNSLRIM
ncbi:MAG TPA: RNA polymerase sigma factor [Terriglobia bacterium]|jgi:RNA polymerase sigma-70 factor (ECF subfamily)